MTSAAARITCETLPGLLRAFRTASDKSCGGGLGTRLHTTHIHAYALCTHIQCIRTTHTYKHTHTHTHTPHLLPPSQLQFQWMSPVQSEATHTTLSCDRGLSDVGRRVGHYYNTMLFQYIVLLIPVLKLTLSTGYLSAL